MQTKRKIWRKFRISGSKIECKFNVAVVETLAASSSLIVIDARDKICWEQRRVLWILCDENIRFLVPLNVSCPSVVKFACGRWTPHFISLSVRWSGRSIIWGKGVTPCQGTRDECRGPPDFPLVFLSSRVSDEFPNVTALVSLVRFFLSN